MDFGQQFREIGTSEFPLKGLGDLYIVGLKIQEPLCDGKTGWESRLALTPSLHHGEVDSRFGLSQLACTGK